jgi:hypothetical protein
MAISEHELSSMTAELDTMHRESFPAVRRALDDFSANLAHGRSSARLGRRAFLGGLGGAVVLGGVAACSSSGGSKGGPSSTGSASTVPSSTMSGSASAGTGTSKYTGDLKVVALAAALENLAVAAYGLALKAAGSGQLGTVPPAVATFVTTAMGQHKDHAAAWNGVLTKAKLPAITGTPLTIADQQVAMLNAAKTVPDVARLALGLETAAAETYTFATANVSDAGGIMTAASIQPVETMHAAILSFVLGEYPVPMSFIGVDKAAQPSYLTV